MREVYSTVKENGLDYAKKIAGELQANGYKIISGPYEAMVPRGEDCDGNPIYVPGYRIIVEDGWPPYVMVSRREIPF